MPPPRPVKRSFLGQCARDLCDIVGCGVLWLLLAGLALLQVWLLVAGELRLPDFVRDRLQTQLATRGLRADYEQATIDPAGTLLVKGVRIATPDNPDPMLTARTLLVRLDPWALLSGQVRVDGVEGSGIALYVPAFLSPSGRAEAVLADAQFRVRMEAPELLTLDAVSGRIAGLPVALDGDLTLPAPRPSPGAGPVDYTAYYPVARRLVTIGEQLRALGELTVRGRVSPGQVDLIARAPLIELANLPLTGLPPVEGEAVNATLGLSVPLAFNARPVARAGVERLHVTLPDGGLPAFAAENVQARLTGAVPADWRDWSDLSLEAGADTLSAFPLVLASTSLHMGMLPGGRVSAEVVTRVDGQPWQAGYVGDPLGGAGEVRLEARPTAGLVQSVEPHVPSRIPLSTLLSLGPPPTLRATVRLAPGGLPDKVEGHLAGGDAVAYGVHIKEAAADFRWEGDSLSFSDILLRINESEARGSYTMGIASREFRFLLAGRLDPPDIGGWFRGWWDDFWSDFAFSTPAVADVEVSGRWGEPFETAVFVAAEGRDTTLRGQPLKTLHTRLFIRPGWYDALHVFARESGGGAADGRFGLAKEPRGKDWDTLDFDFDSTLPTAALVRLLGEGAEPVFAPYDFTRPPHIRISGNVRTPDRRDVRFTASTDSPFLFEGFGVESLAVEGRMEDQVITLDPMTARVAGGELTGRAVVSGPDADRWLALDHRLTGASLDTILDLLAARQAASEGVKPEAAPRRPGGKLDLTLQATGPLPRPEELQGSGRAAITGAHFAEINLLGPLSDVFKSTGLGFTSLSLESLTTRYELDGGVLRFPNLRLTGPSAVVEASGRYVLEDGKLDFRAKLFPYEGKGGVLSNAADFVLSPLSNALEFRLGGSLEKPDWSFTYGPRGWLRGLTGDRENASSTEPEDGAGTR